MDGLDELTEVLDGFKLFPNPTQNIFKVEMRMLQAEAVHFQLFDLMGRVIEQKAFSPQFGQISHTFDLSQQAAGIYLLRMNIAGEQVTRRIVRN
jgi:hypothetical protein